MVGVFFVSLLYSIKQPVCTIKKSIIKLLMLKKIAPSMTNTKIIAEKALVLKV